MSRRQEYYKAIGHKALADLIVAEFARQGVTVGAFRTPTSTNDGDRLIVDLRDDMAICTQFAIYSALEYESLAEVVSEYL